MAAKRKRTEYHREYAKRPDARLRRLKAYAKKKGIPYDLPDEVALVLLKLVCSYCDQYPPSYTLALRSPVPGYVAGNVLPVCDRCAYASSNMTQHQFVLWLSKVYHRLQGAS